MIPKEKGILLLKSINYEEIYEKVKNILTKALQVAFGTTCLCKLYDVAVQISES